MPARRAGSGGRGSEVCRVVNSAAGNEKGPSTLAGSPAVGRQATRMAWIGVGGREGSEGAAGPCLPLARCQHQVEMVGGRLCVER